MQIHKALSVRPGVTAVIGSGGKTSLLHALAAALPGRVILCTTTKIYPSHLYSTLVAPDAARVAAHWAGPGAPSAVCVGAPLPGGKLGPCGLSMAQLCALADYVLVEADGSQGLPLKAHAPWEPVVPPEANQTICVVGASGFCRSVAQAVHRPALWQPADTAPESVALMLRREHLADTVYVNQCESETDWQHARTLQRYLPMPVFAGSLKEGTIQCLF